MEADGETLIPPAAWIECTADIVPPCAGLGAVDLRCGQLLRPPLAPRELRTAQSIAARELGRTMLLAAGAPHDAIGRHPDGQPLWPVGFTGSISHVGAHFVVATASTDETAALGVDLESPDRLHPEMWANIFTAAEQRWLQRHVSGPEVSTAATVMFAAKEAAYKMLFPRHGAVAGFLDAEVEINGHAVVTRLAHASSGVPREVRGRWFRLGPHVLVVCAG